MILATSLVVDVFSDSIYKVKQNQYQHLAESYNQV